MEHLLLVVDIFVTHFAFEPLCLQLLLSVFVPGLGCVEIELVDF